MAKMHGDVFGVMQYVGQEGANIILSNGSKSMSIEAPKYRGRFRPGDLVEVAKAGNSVRMSVYERAAQSAQSV